MSQTASSIAAFATTAPGLEPILATELRDAGFGRNRIGGSGVSFHTDRHGLERACLTLRSAHRVLWSLGGVDASSPEALLRTMGGLVRWQGLIGPGKTFVISATTRNNEALRDHRYVARVAKDAIVDAIRAATNDRPSVDFDNPDVVVRVSISGRQGIVSLDATGTRSLHARGYRTEAGEAPLRETLAYGLLALAEWDPREPLVDPMCGSGTIPIEAALYALNRAPGLVAYEHGRRFGFENWAGFRQERLDGLLDQLRANVQDMPEGLRIFGSDIATPEIRIARENAARAGVAHATAFTRADAFNWRSAPGERGLIITNPPYGARLDPGMPPQRFYAALGEHLMKAAPGWRVAILAPGPKEAEALAIPHLRWVNLHNGDIPIIACLGTIPD